MLQGQSLQESVRQLCEQELQRVKGWNSRSPVWDLKVKGAGIYIN